MSEQHKYPDVEVKSGAPEGITTMSQLSQRDYDVSHADKKSMHTVNNQCHENLSQTEISMSQGHMISSLIGTHVDTSTNQKDVHISQAIDDIIVFEEEVVDTKKETVLCDTSCSPLSSCLPDVINRQEINHIDCLRMRNTLSEILEEVKLRRNNDVENEEIIRRLVQEKYELERKLDGEKLRLVSLGEDHEKKSSEIKRQFEDKIKVLQAEVKQNQVFRDCVENETKSLKDDIRNLQITNYNLGKKLKEQGRKLQLQISSANQHLNQLSSAEDKFKAVSTYCKKLSENQDRLNRNVKEAVKLNRDLMYTNEHQKCIIEQHKREVTLLQGQLIDTKVKLDSKPCSDTTRIQQEQEITSVKQQLQNEKEEHSELREELSKITCDYKEVLDKLQDSHKLIERHLQNAEAHQREANTLSTDLDECKDKMKKLETALDSLNKELHTEKTLHSQSVETWSKQEEELRSKLSVLSEELANEKSSREELEQLNTTWSEQNVKISEELNKAKAILEVPKEDGHYQTELSMLNVADAECQIKPESSTFGGQTEQARRYHISSQTDPPPCSDFCSQTFAPALAVSSTQTKEPSLVNRYAQTDKDSDKNDAIEGKQNSVKNQTTVTFQGGKCSDLTTRQTSDIINPQIYFEQKHYACTDIATKQVESQPVQNDDNEIRSSCTIIEGSQSDSLAQPSVLDLSQPYDVTESVKNTTAQSDLLTSTNNQSKDPQQSTVTVTKGTENVIFMEPVSEKGTNSNHVPIETRESRGCQGVFSLNKEFVKLYDTENVGVIEHRISPYNMEITSSKNCRDSENSQYISNTKSTQNELKTLDKNLVVSDEEKGTDFMIIEEAENKMEDKITLIQKPKKMSLYESHLHGYMSKISTGKIQQNSSVGMKLVKPRDNQDAPRIKKYVEYLQPSDKSSILKDDGMISKVKNSSPRGSLSLIKRKTASIGAGSEESKTDDKAFCNVGRFTEKRSSAVENVLFTNVSRSSSKEKISRSNFSSYNSESVDKSYSSEFQPKNRLDSTDLSPYSRYKALLTPRVDNSSIDTIKTRTDRNIKDKVKKAGILKEFVIEGPSEKERKNVTFSENIVEVKNMSPQLELSGDQSLYSDEEPEEEVIELIQSQEDCSVEKRPRLV